MKVTKADIDRNFEHVRKGEALDMPLAVLDGKLKRKCYGHLPEVKAKRKAYQQTDKYKAYRQQPEVKAQQKAYQQTDKYKAYQKAYYQRPEVKARMKARRKAYYLNVRKPKIEARKGTKT